jgi:hypothetical protein
VTCLSESPLVDGFYQVSQAELGDDAWIRRGAPSSAGSGRVCIEFTIEDNDPYDHDLTFGRIVVLGGPGARDQVFRDRFESSP